MHEVDLSGARLILADMAAARLVAANLSQAVLRGSNLEMANLQETRFEGTDLSDVSIREAKLWHVKLDHASVVTNVQWWTANFYTPLTDTSVNTMSYPPDIEELDLDEPLIAELLSRSDTKSLIGAHESIRNYQQMQANEHL